MNDDIVIMDPYCLNDNHLCDTQTRCRDANLEIIRLARLHGMLVGSRRFGLHSEDSDYDYVVLAERLAPWIDLDSLARYNSNNRLPTYGFKIIIAPRQATEEAHYRLVQKGEIERMSLLSTFLQLLEQEGVRPHLTVNVLVALSEEELEQWRTACSLFGELCESENLREVVRNKEHRVRIFEVLREHVGLGDEDEEA